MKEYDVYGIGSALMDFLIEVDDSTLDSLGLKKGQFHLYPEKEAQEMLDKLAMEKVTIVPGGSAANTVAGVGLLGGKCVFNGKVGKDKHGELYATETQKGGVKPNLAVCEKNMTGYALTFITPDSERTFVVHLGAAPISRSDIFEEDVKKSKILHIEGYLLEHELTREAAEHAMKTAKENDVMVSIDLGDPGVVERSKEHVMRLVKEYADIVFANEGEAKAFTGLEEEDALNKIAEDCSIAVVKIGVRGSMIKHDGRTVKVNAIKASAVDTTGAGDMYAAGFLYALSKGLSVEEGARIGSLAASFVVSQIGARLMERIHL